jgi:pimeloyl-ACP methyl ester carboxylesterase
MPLRLYATLLCSLCCLIPAAAAHTDGIELRDCELKGSQGVSLVEARCGTLLQPEDPDEPDGPRIELTFAVVDSLSPEPKADAFTVINGGPGGSSLELYADSAGAFQGILRERDIVLVDQRGTGQSTPLDCPELATLPGGLEPAAVRAATDACLASLKADPRFFTTSVAVRDLDAVREALGLEQLNVYGVSYGTRVAMHYARHYPERTRTLVLDGVVPPGLALGPNAAINAERTFRHMLTRCAGDPACNAAFPGLDARFDTVADRLRQAPLTLELPDPVSGEQRSIDLAYEHLAVTVRMLSYAPETVSLIPVIVNEAYANENYQPIASNALRIVSELANLLSAGMHNAVVCTEDVPFWGDVDWAALEATYLGADQVRALAATCERWPRGVYDEDLHAPLEVAVPTLILSGSEDPITPPGYGDEVARTLPKARHVIGPGQGHGIFNRGCVPRLISEFVADADPMALDTTCVDRLTAQPFFVDLMGPAP